MRHRIAAVMLLLGLGLTTSAFADDWASYRHEGYRDRSDVWRDYRDIRHDRCDLNRDYQKLARDRWNGNWYAVEHDRRDIWNDRRDMRNDYRDVNRDRGW